MRRELIKQILQIILLIPLIGLDIFFLLGIYDNLDSELDLKTDTESIQTVQKQADIESIKMIQKTILAKRVDWEELRAEIAEIIDEEDEKYAYYIENLSTGESVQFNEDLNVHPASIYKVPLAIAVLKQVDEGEINMNSMLLVTSAEKPYSFDLLSKREGEYEISVEETLTYLIRYSDNTAMTTLEHRLGGVEQLQADMAKLGIGGVTRLPGESTAPAVAKMMRALYEQSILTEDSNKFLLNLMKDMAPGQNDRIPAGVPDEIEVAHKIGTLTSTYHDAGIVYGEDNDYLIVVLNEDIEPSTARSKIRRISEVTYNYLNLVATKAE
ncbi:hypothetical protein GF389_03990 [Candidatus Dojkabacteria bacterium]|nr:hypothetical protein [Candidatus Dojkabacteria bacterium]